MSPRPQPGREYVLTLSCPDRAGLVHAVSSFLVRHSGNILESQQFDDRLQDRFFMRVHFDVSDPDADLEELRDRFRSGRPRPTGSPGACATRRPRPGR